MHKVFVYGTLLSGQTNHRLLAGATKLGEARTYESGWVMLDLGRYPALVKHPDGSQVVGELYEVDDETLARLDALEGYPAFYNRTVVWVSVGPPEDYEYVIKAWVYYLPNGEDRMPKQRKLVPNNDWRAHINAKRGS